jgi:hypothetical protein
VWHPSHGPSLIPTLCCSPSKSPVPKVPKSKKSTLVKELNGREYEGCEVKKHFDGFGTFEGMVISTRRDPLCWLVRYADGDEEVAKHAQP